jgi:hypothetical protein
MKIMGYFTVLSVSLGLVFSGAAGAEVEVNLSHKDTPNGAITQVLSVANGENIKVVVTDTHTDNFDVPLLESSSFPIPLPRLEPTSLAARRPEHSDKFGGYYVKVKLKEGRPAGDLKDKTWIVAVQETGWRTDVQVGLVGSGLVSPKFFLDTGEDGVKRVFQDREAEDDVALGFASFATVYHDRRPLWGLSLGLGAKSRTQRTLRWR